MHMWADTGSNEIKYLGTASISLNKIGRAKFIQRQFVDEITRKTITFQARVLESKETIKSAYSEYQQHVVCKMWFQKELPYPDLDLNALKDMPIAMNTSDEVNKLLGENMIKFPTSVLAKSFKDCIERNFDQTEEAKQRAK